MRFVMRLMLNSIVLMLLLRALHIVSFLPNKLEPKDSDAWTQTKVNELINNNFMLSRPKFKGKYFLRVVMGNYNTKDSDIKELLRLLDA